MARLTVTELATTVEELQAQIAELSKHVAYLEKRHAGANGAAQAPVPAAAPPVQAQVPAVAEITEEELLAISAAIGAYLGVRAHIRQIRLVSTSAWAQQGRVSIQASHRLQG
jgi:methylmalonyl-CoA carboxyltransferase large subunit